MSAAFSPRSFPPELEGLGFAELRARLLKMWIPTNDCANVSDLKQRWAEWDGIDRSDFSLPRLRKNWRDAGLLPCSAPGCLKSEDFSTTFLVCGKCKRAAYCSRECQAAHWKSGHKSECVKPPADPTAAASGRKHEFLLVLLQTYLPSGQGTACISRVDAPHGNRRCLNCFSVETVNRTPGRRLRNRKAIHHWCMSRRITPERMM